jgi:hypothetical protein
MTEFETKLIDALNRIGRGLEVVSVSIDNAPSIDKEIDEHGTAIERGFAEVAKSIDSLEINR